MSSDSVGNFPVTFGCVRVLLPLENIINKTKVISADLLEFDFDFEDIIMLGNISVLVTFQFW